MQGPHHRRFSLQHNSRMSVSFKNLKSFVTAVDASSLSAAAQTLKMAQPALSQQIATLELHFGHRLLQRSNTGVTATVAGHELYRHARLLLDQLDQAERDVARKGQSIGGTVSVGLATYSTTSILSTPLLKATRERYPDINLFINDNFGLVLSEMVMTDRMDMAIIYAPNQLKGVTLQPLLVEELFLIAPPGTPLPTAIQRHDRTRRIGRLGPAAARAHAFPAQTDRRCFRTGPAEATRAGRDRIGRHVARGHRE